MYKLKSMSEEIQHFYQENVVYITTEKLLKPNQNEISNCFIKKMKCKNHGLQKLLPLSPLLKTKWVISKNVKTLNEFIISSNTNVIEVMWTVLIMTRTDYF